MSRRLHRATKGSVILVVLCFVAVLGVGLASYLALSTQAMKFSNRSARNEYSRQLAELGIEEALRAFNTNNWADWSNGGLAADWTVSGTTATCTMTFPADKFGQGVTGSVKIRIDNYNANQLDSTWSSSATYRINDLVGYNGTWYRCIQSHTNQAPVGGISNYWAPEGVSWTWNSTTTYALEAMVNRNGYWYQCINVNINSAPTGTPTSNSNWTYVPAVTKDNTTGVFGIQDAVVNWLGVWWRWNAGAWNNTPPISWRWRNVGMIYRYNDTVCFNYVWYRYISATPTDTTSTYSTPDTDGARWSPLTSQWSWSSGSINYNLGDAVYYSSTSMWYRCILAHASSGSITPANTTYWSNTPHYSTAWDSNRQYSQNDTVRYNGVWYLSLQNSNTNQNPVTATTYWIGANTATASYQWNATTAYSAGAYRCYGGVWYRCTTATTANAGHNPNNTSYWTAAWAQASGVTTGAPVIYAEGTVTLPDGSPAIKTQVRAVIAPAPLFPNAAGAITGLYANASTNTAIVDSYDASTNPSYDTAPKTFSAVLAVNNPPVNTDFNINNTQVRGYIAAPSASTSPFAPRWTRSGGATVTGTITGSGVDFSRVSRSPHIPQFNTLPIGGLATNWATTPKGTLLPTATTVNLGTPGATTPSRYYYAGSLIMGGGSSVITTMNINGPVILHINGDLSVTAAPMGSIIIKDTGSAEIHASGGFKFWSTGGGLINQTLDPKRCILISDNTSAEQFYNSISNPNFYGVIYAPNTTYSSGFQFNSGGGASTVVYGAVSAAKITFINNMNIHYDTSLRYATIPGVEQPWAVTEWRELDATEQATLP